jgi:hypothetical protein
VFCAVSVMRDQSFVDELCITATAFRTLERDGEENINNLTEQRYAIYQR